MENKKQPSTDKEWIDLLETKDWKIPAGDNSNNTQSGTLRDLIKIAHGQHKSGQEPGIVSHVETAIELDMIQLQKLWEYLGLPQ